jgi:peptidyl-prolyl cis-trans isomerase B (cyclophilin B)
MELVLDKMLRSAGRQKYNIILPVMAMLLLVSSPALATDPVFGRMETDAGDILLVFYPELAPHHVDNFVHFARTGFYEGTVFHRIIPGFMIQGGDPNSKDADPRNDGTGSPMLADILDAESAAVVENINAMLAERGYAPVNVPVNLKAEFSRKVSHDRGVLSMARSNDPDSAGSQFFICHANAAQLDGSYTVFGYAVTGLDVVDIIATAEKNPAAGRDYPAIPVHIKKITIFEGTGDLTADEKTAWDALPAEKKSVQ